MTPELEETIFKRYPDLFERRNLSSRESCMAWGLACGDGWAGIITDLCDKISGLDADVQFEQVKNKFGLLRIYMHGGEQDDTIEKLVVAAEHASATTCESCGSSATYKQFRVRCHKCELLPA